MEDYSDHLFDIYNKKCLDFIENVTSSVDEIQQQVLSEIVSRSANVEYLQRHGLDGHIDRETFKKIMPVITYEYIQHDINRIANGDTSPILCAHPISEFLTSSGTSGGESKLLPTIEEQNERKAFIYGLLMPIINQYIPGLNKGKGMYFLFTRSESKTPGGLVARSALTSYYKSSHFKERTYDPYTNYTSPIQTIHCQDHYQSMYSQLLCGLYQNNEVLRVGAVFASGFIHAIQFLQTHWTLLCYDIRTGTVQAEISDPLVREAVLKILRPNRKLAEFIEIECSRVSWQGIITRLWPNTKYIEVIVTGSMSSYIPSLDYYSNSLPLVCTRYASSECFFGINLEPLAKPSEVSYTLIPTLAYFEFLPYEKSNGVTKSVSVAGSLCENEKEKLVDLVDVKLGHEYELVVTTYAGLYRYRVGDLLRVSGFKNKAPQFNFMRRKDVILSIDFDKTDEVELQNAIKNAINHLEPSGATLVDYTSYADTSTIPGHYVLYWELSRGETKQISSSIFEKCCLTIENSLSSVYRQLRVSEKSIGPLEIKMVDTGTFEKLMDYVISRGGSLSQYKTPRCVKLAPIVELLNSKVVSNYFSPKCPELVPSRKELSNLEGSDDAVARKTNA